MTKVSLGPPPPLPPGDNGPSSDAATTTTFNPPSAAGPVSTTPVPPPSPSLKVPMGPPPPRNPTSSSNSAPNHNDNDSEMTTAPESGPGPVPSAEGPQPEQIVLQQANDSEEEVRGASGGNREKDSNSVDVAPRSKVLAAPYSIPSWSEHPGHPFYVEVLKDGAIIEQLDVSVKGAYMFGRVDSCDFVLEHPTISRFHAVLQFKKSGDAFIYDLGSTHGTSINKSQVA